MTYHRSFEHFNPFSETFDPFNGDVPASEGTAFGDIVKRATRILEQDKQRSIDEINACLPHLDEMLRKGEELFTLESIRVLDTTDEDTYYQSDTKILRFYMERFELEQQESFPVTTWSDYFAVLALAMVGEAHNTERSDELDLFVKEGFTTQEQVKEYTSQIIKDYAIDGMEAVSFAEHLAQQQWEAKKRKDANKKLKRDAGREGGKIRSTAYRKLEQEVIQLYIEISERFFKIGRNLSDRTAAEIISTTLHEQRESEWGQITVSKRTIREWISRHKASPNSKFR